MALIDYKAKLSDNQAITGTAASSNVIDFQLANPDLGEGTPLFLHVLVTTDFGSTNSTAKVQVQLQDSADNSSFSTLSETDAVVVTSLSAGTEFAKLALPDTHRRYVKANYVCSVENPNAGKVTAWIAPY